MNITRKLTKIKESIKLMRESDIGITAITNNPESQEIRLSNVRDE